jgi:hypothetical protein
MNREKAVVRRKVFQGAKRMVVFTLPRCAQYTAAPYKDSYREINLARNCHARQGHLSILPGRNGP